MVAGGLPPANEIRLDWKPYISVVIGVVMIAGETPVRRMLGVLQAIINGQQPDMRAVHQLHELIVSGDINGDVSLCWNPTITKKCCRLFGPVAKLT